MSDTRSKAEALVNALLEVDEIGSVPIPASAKRYARMTSKILFKDHGQAKEKLFIDQTADTTNQQGKKQGFKNYDGAAYTGRKAKQEAVGEKDWLKKHGVAPGRRIQIKRDPANEKWYQIPVFDRGRKAWNMLKPGTNPRNELKKRIQWLVRNRAGYQPGDVFVSIYANWLVTDSLGIKEV